MLSRSSNATNLGSPYQVLTRARQERIRRVHDRLSFGLFVAGIVLNLTVSGYLLGLLGIPYATPTGHPIFKIHPGTYFILTAFASTFLLDANPLAIGWNAIRGAKPVALYALMTVWMLTYSVARYGISCSAYIVETLVMPAICVFEFRQFSNERQRSILKLVFWLLVLNAVLGIAEAAAQHNVIPMMVRGQEVEITEFRATALLGHPLNNALMTSPMVFISLAMPLKTRTRLTLVALFVLALLAFGGRTGFLSSTIAVVLYLLVIVIRRLLAGQFSYLQVTGGLVGILVAAAALVAAVLGSGLGERIFGRLTWDDSADVRLYSWHALDLMSRSDIVFGISPAKIQTIIDRLGILTIENFWLFLLMQTGAIGIAAFILGLASAVRFFWKPNPAASRLAMVLFIVTASGNNSLASKTCSLCILFILLCGTMAVRAKQVALEPIGPHRSAVAV